MNRLWVRLWLGIMAAFVGFVVSFEVAEVAVSLARTAFPRPGGSETVVIIVSNVVGVLLSVLFAALIAWRLTQPLSAVSRAARRFAEGDLSTRARYRQGRGARRFGGEAVRLVDDFNVMAASLERLEAERKVIAATIAHELRTPLAVLQARLAALRDGVFALDLREVGLLEQQTDQLARLVEDLRTLSLADAGKLTLTLRPCDLSALVRDVVTASELQAAEKGVRLETQLASATVQGDAGRLRQVVTNLLDNALRFTPAAGSVTLLLKTDDGGATLVVQDTGPGFGAGDEARVFERFYRADAGRSGSGLGLAVVRSLAEAHGGWVAANNAPGGGAVLEVWLPLQKSVSKVGSSRGVIGGGR